MNNNYTKTIPIISLCLVSLASVTLVQAQFFDRLFNNGVNNPGNQQGDQNGVGSALRNMMSVNVP